MPAPIKKTNDKSYKSKLAPSSYSSVNKFNEAVEKYVDNCKIFRNIPNEAGMSLYLGFPCSKDMLLWIEKNRRFEPCLSRARTILEDRGIQLLTDPTNKNGNGCHRYMSKNFGYNDKIDINQQNTTRIIRLPAKAPIGSTVGEILKEQKRSNNFKKKKKVKR